MASLKIAWLFLDFPVLHVMELSSETLRNWCLTGKLNRNLRYYDTNNTYKWTYLRSFAVTVTTEIYNPIALRMGNIRISDNRKIEIIFNETQKLGLWKFYCLLKYRVIDNSRTELIKNLLLIKNDESN